MGHPAAEAAPDGCAWGDSDQQTLPRYPIVDTSEPSVGPAGKSGATKTNQIMDEIFLTGAGCAHRVVDLISRIDRE